MRKLPKVSFIIPTLNAAGILPRCLEAIRSQDYPQQKVEIVVADGGSTDDTVKIAKRYKAKVISNPEVLHEPGKARASEVAKGEILFFTDADNILSRKQWIRAMVKPYLEYPGVVGFLSQTLPAPDSNSLDRYLGYLSTDPFTWFVYQDTAAGRTYGEHYKPLKKTKDYIVYKFPLDDHPLFGLSQGVGTVTSFKRGKLGHSDDILSGIKLISEGGLVAYVPQAGIYHYHLKGLPDFIKKYTWRIRNNFTQKVKGMGLVHRQRYFNAKRKLRQFLFVPYALSIVLPILDTIRLFYLYKDPAVLWHPFASFILAALIIKEGFFFSLGKMKPPGTYGK